MILSMTGHGQSQKQSETHSVDCEVRAVNNRFLKFNLSWNDRFANLESALQKVVRKHVRRGTIYVSFKVSSLATESSYSLNTKQLQTYRKQIQDYDVGFAQQVGAGDILNLPGVIEESDAADSELELIWPLMEQALDEALEHLTEMRSQEGASMASDLLKNTQTIEDELASISNRAPLVVDGYSKKLTEKINAMLESHDTSVTSADIVREVGIFADRSDISEEIVRLNSHIDLFRANIDSSRGDGRKLEFVTQEMLRETNTIGSKANDSEIARNVVEIKTAIERIREMVQNIE